MMYMAAHGLCNLRFAALLWHVLCSLAVCVLHRMQCMLLPQKPEAESKFLTHYSKHKCFTQCCHKDMVWRSLLVLELLVLSSDVLAFGIPHNIWKT